MGAVGCFCEKMNNGPDVSYDTQLWGEFQKTYITNRDQIHRFEDYAGAIHDLPICHYYWHDKVWGKAFADGCQYLTIIVNTVIRMIVICII